MNKLLTFMAVLPLLALSAQAQEEGTRYYLPKTELHFQLLVEKSVYTPGEFALY